MLNSNLQDKNQRWLEMHVKTPEQFINIFIRQI